MSRILFGPFTEHEQDGFKFEREGGVNEFRVVTTGYPPAERTPKHCLGDTFYATSKHDASRWDKLTNEEKVALLKDNWRAKMFDKCPIVATQKQSQGDE